MSNINKVKIINPYGETDDALMLHLDSLDDGYHLSDLIDYCSNYTFSIWHKADSDNIIQFNIFGETHEINSTKTWQKFIHTTTVSSLDNMEISIYSHTNTNFYLYEAFLCEGDIDLSWSPAPEDLEDRFAKIEVDANKILLEVGKKVGDDEIISRINQSAEEIQIEAQKINLKGAVTADCIVSGAVTTEKLDADNLHIGGNSTFDGIIQAKAGGTIGGFDIGKQALYNGTDSIDSELTGVYVGTDGIRSNSGIHKYILQDGVSYYGDPEKDMTHTIITDAGSEWVLSHQAEVWNEMSGGRIEVLYNQNPITFLKKYKAYDSDETELQHLGGIDAMGIFKGAPNEEFASLNDTILYWNGNAKLNYLKTTDIINAGAEIFLQNGIALRGLKVNSTSTSDNNVIGYINNTNRAILGHAGNTAPTELRSPTDLYLKCNGNITDDNNECGIKFWYTNNAAWFRPCKDGVTNLGGTDYHWDNVYAKNGTIQTSDINQKRDITEIDDRYIKLFDLIEPYAYHFIDGDRVHTGFISQYVEDAMSQVGLTAEELGFFCKDIKTKTVEDDNGELIEVPEYDEDGNLQYIYALRYEEYIAIITKKVKQLENKIDSQQEQINKLLEMIQAQQKTLDTLMK